jgi:hypothetical protein
MGIPESLFGIIWQAIEHWRNVKGLEPAQLVFIPGYPEHVIKRGIKNKSDWITSDFLRNCYDCFGLTSARMRSPEDDVDILTDEQIIAELTAPLRFREDGKQGRLQI